MRIVILGAGAIGGVLGAALHQSGQDVLLVARGAHYKAISEKGLSFATLGAPPTLLSIPVIDDLAKVEFTGQDVIVLAVKSQDSSTALDNLRQHAPLTAPVLCAQNGVENERMAIRRFSNVYAAHVLIPATYLSVGSVGLHCEPNAGIFDIGCYPTGEDRVSIELARMYSVAGFSSKPMADIMRWKYAKLIRNLGTLLNALFGDGYRHSSIDDRISQEAIDCFTAAGIDFASAEEYEARRRESGRTSNRGEMQRPGTSIWQSLERGIGSIEADYLHGEVVMLGHLYGVRTPVNAALQALANQAAKDRRPPGSYQPETLWEMVGA